MSKAGKIAALLLCFLVGLTIGRNTRKKPAGAAKRSDTVRVVVVDTVRYREPVARDSMMIRYATVRVPYHIADVGNMTDTAPCLGRKEYAYETAGAGADMCSKDTIQIHIPITQKRYEDSTYRAWVSGYRPALDSIEVYPRRETITVTNTVTRYRPRRWGVGVQAGYGITSRGEFYPYIGVGISWNLLSL